MAVLLHLSDTHFGTETPEVVTALLDLSARLRPEVAVLSGDVTQRARAGQFDTAHKFMRALTAQAKLVLPGNHDLPLFNLWARWRTPYAGFERVFGSRRSLIVHTPEFLVLGVDTTRAKYHKTGEVSPAQVAEVAQHLRAAQPGQLKVVVTHQPMAVITQEDRKNLLRGHAHALQAWSDAGVDLLLGGHIHLPYAMPLTLSLGMGDHPATPWVVQAGTAVSKRLRGGSPNSVHLIEWADSAAGKVCRLMQYDYLSGPRCFAQVGPAVELWPAGRGNGPATSTHPRGY